MIVCPFSIAVDTREQLPYTFQNMRIDRKKAFVITQRCTLSTGDYSIIGLERKVCVERKSLRDLFGTLGRERERFMQELARAESYDYSAVIIEGSWQQIANPVENDPLFYSRAHPNSIIGTIVSFARKFPKTRWKAAGNRANAEKTTFDILLNFYKQHVTDENEIHAGNTGTDNQPTGLEIGIPCAGNEVYKP